MTLNLKRLLLAVNVLCVAVNVDTLGVAINVVTTLALCYSLGALLFVATRDVAVDPPTARTVKP